MLEKLSEGNKDHLKKKFDIAYFVTNHKLAFNKYTAICNLESHHGVNIGTSYVNENAGKTFCKFIAETRMAELCKTVTNTKFFSILMDGTTNVDKIDDDCFLFRGVMLMEQMRRCTLEWSILQFPDQRVAMLKAYSNVCKMRYRNLVLLP